MPKVEHMLLLFVRHNCSKTVLYGELLISGSWEGTDLLWKQS